MPQVECRPATVDVQQQPGVQLKDKHNIRVAAYCRVSSDDEDQQTSYEGQCAYYRKLITEKEDWYYAGIYADEGITGTSRDRRTQFNQMMEDALNGKIDYIITKAVSRFARNTLDTLSCVRELRLHNPPIGVFFEKEGLDSLDPTCELVLTMLSAIAQEESRSTSTNLKWGNRRRFKEGICSFNSKLMIGYDEDWVINEEQARTVRYIYRRFLEGATSPEIAKELNTKGWLSQNNKKWSNSTICHVLKNEKYVGDVILQKYITPDFLTHQCVRNTGEVPQYYVKDHHTAIISREDWDRVQEIFQEKKEQREARKAESAEKRAALQEAKYTANPLTNLYCGQCGAPYKKAKYAGYLDHQTYGYNYYAYRCSTKFAYRSKKGPASKGEVAAMGFLCPSETVLRIAVEQSFMELLYAIKRDVEKHGEDADIWVRFKAELEKVRREEDSTFSQNRLEVILGQIAEVETKLKALKYGAQGDDQQEAALKQQIQALKQQIKALQQEQALLESELGGVPTLERNFRAFLKALKTLPEINAAGMWLKVNGVDTNGSAYVDRYGNPKNNHSRLTPEQVAESPDMLVFDRDIYHRFFLKGVVKDNGNVKCDAIEFSTSFGLKLTSVGNSRKLQGFYGYRVGNPDGTVKILQERWQVAGGMFKLGERKKRSKRSKDAEGTEEQAS